MIKKINTDKRQGFVYGSIILIASNVIVKIVGALFKIPLHSLIGDEGMGYFVTAFNFFSIFLTVAIAGMPVAISALVSKATAENNLKKMKMIYNVAFVILFILGVFFSIIMLRYAQQYTKMMKNNNAYLTVMAISPSIFFMCIISSVRGYFQGLQNMYPTAISQLIESICKLGIGLTSAFYLKNMNMPVPVVAAGAIMGITVGSVFSSIYLIIKKKFSKTDRSIINNNIPIQTKVRKRTITKDLIMIAFPITISSILISITRFLDNFMVLNRLQNIGFTSKQANMLYGNFEGVVGTIFNMPNAVIFSLSVAIIPVISYAFEKKNQSSIKFNVNTAFRLSSIISMPASILFMLMPYEILSLLYNAHSAKQASTLLAIMGPSCLILAFVTIASGILQSIGKSFIPLISVFLSAIVKVVMNYILIGDKDIGIKGIAISTFAFYTVDIIINLIFLYKEVKVMPSILNCFVKPFISSLGSVLVGRAFYLYVGSIIGFSKLLCIISFFMIAIIYVVLLIITGTVTKEDIKMLPFKDKIVKR